MISVSKKRAREGPEIFRATKGDEHVNGLVDELHSKSQRQDVLRRSVQGLENDLVWGQLEDGNPWPRRRNPQEMAVRDHFLKREKQLANAHWEGDNASIEPESVRKLYGPREGFKENIIRFANHMLHHSTPAHKKQEHSSSSKKQKGGRLRKASSRKRKRK